MQFHLKRRNLSVIILNSRVNLTLIGWNVQHVDERLWCCKPNVLIVELCLLRKVLLTDAAVGLLQTLFCWTLSPDKAYFSHAADDTTGTHLSKQQTWAQELALPDSCTKSTSNRPHQTPAPCSDCDHKTTIIQKQMRERIIPKSATLT